MLMLNECFAAYCVLRLTEVELICFTLTQVCTHMLLQSQTSAPEVQQFAAQTLCQKVRRQLNTLSDQDIISLREQVVSCLARASSGPFSVLIQLCTAMALLMAQRPAANDPFGAFGTAPFLPIQQHTLEREFSMSGILILVLQDP